MKCWVAPKILKTVQIPLSLFGLETLRFEAWTLDRDLASGLSTMIDNDGWLGLDQGDRQALEQRYTGCDPPCLLDSSDGRSGIFSMESKYQDCYLFVFADLSLRGSITTRWM